MTDTAPAEGRVRQTLRGLSNVATIWGSVLVLGGVALMGLPGQSRLAVESALGVVLLAVGVSDARYALTGKQGRLAARSRVRAGFRAPFVLFVAPYLILSPSENFEALIAVVGLYVFVRGLGSLMRIGVRRARGRPAAGFRVATLRTAVGALAVAAPTVLSGSAVLVLGVGGTIVGLVLLVRGIRAAAPGSDITLTQDEIPRILWAALVDADIGDERRGRIGDSIYFERPELMSKFVAWWVMLLLAGAIASFAVLADSTAVVIGAMIIAPLMVPILGLAGALVNGWPRRANASFLLVVGGAAAVIVLSAFLAEWVTPLVALDVNTQVQSRVNPTLVDLLIAVAAGAAGAFATVHVRVASSIAGVAIAVALVPPLCVVGITFVGGDRGDSFGALLLFVTNFVGIVLTAALVFVLTGYADPTVLRARSRQLALAIAPFGALAIVVMLPLLFAQQSVIAEAALSRDVNAVVERWLEPTPDLRLVEVNIEGDDIRVVVTGPSTLPPVSDLEEEVTDTLNRRMHLVVEFSPSEVTETDVGPPAPSF